MRLLFLLLLLFSHVASYKFLVVSPKFATSHSNFLARISEVLADAGHEVVMLSPIMNSKGGAATRNVRVIEVPQCAEAIHHEQVTSVKMSENFWTAAHPMQMMSQMGEMIETWAHTCKSAIVHPGLIEQLKAEKFDAAFGQSMDMCLPVIVHLLGIDKWATTDSVALRDGAFHYTQVPSTPSYVPTLMKGSSDQMSFMGRFSNMFSYVMLDVLGGVSLSMVDKILRTSVPDLPHLKELMTTNSLAFLNSEPLVDFPKLTAARIIDIGGITVSSGHEAVNQTWSDILDLRQHTILLSFGTMAKSFNMPENYKHTIRETFRKFPDVTFIWKYEKPEHRVSEGIDNVVESTWIPQRDILHDPRLSAFITHCGQGSTTESIDAGIPLIVIPIRADQMRNAHQVERNKIGIRLERDDLEKVGKLEEAIRNILSNDSYRQTARRLKEMIADRPFSMKEIFVKNMEFLAKHGPLRQLDHYGRHLNFFQYYLIDVIAFVSLILLCVLAVIFLTLKCCVKKVLGGKVKQE